ncbi:hypothetical protein QJS10_CPA10g01805 [Acorus calamus]|uniref:Uncharacterized protein n=1 Tax=Acorus calamus TaxID=4465 RepID=A0AAV9DXM8_ACOCL|nr:hypothetical protein QJS10_CPA10g01805 [Acorus calamus]
MKMNPKSNGLDLVRRRRSKFWSVLVVEGGDVRWSLRWLKKGRSTMEERGSLRLAMVVEGEEQLSRSKKERGSRAGDDMEREVLTWNGASQWQWKE